MAIETDRLIAPGPAPALQGLLTQIAAGHLSSRAVRETRMEGQGSICNGDLAYQRQGR